jgi:hypothetical protein
MRLKTREDELLINFSTCSLNAIQIMLKRIKSESWALTRFASALPEHPRLVSHQVEYCLLTLSASISSNVIVEVPCSQRSPTTDTT